MKHIGLTDDMNAARTAHGNPPDWCKGEIESKERAYLWVRLMLSSPDYRGELEGKEWRHWYVHAIDDETRQAAQFVDAKEMIMLR